MNMCNVAYQSVSKAKTFSTPRLRTDLIFFFTMDWTYVFVQISYENVGKEKEGKLEQKYRL